MKEKRLLVEDVLGLLNPGKVVIVESSPDKNISPKPGDEQQKLLTRCYRGFKGKSGGQGGYNVAAYGNQGW